MGFFTFLVCVCMVVCAGLFLGLKFYPRSKCRLSSESMELGLLYTALLVGSGIMCLYSFLSLSSFTLMALGSLAILGISDCSFSKMGKVALSFLLCFISASFLYPFSGHFLHIFSLALFWGASWGIFVFFDRFPFVSSLVSFSWALGIVSVGLIVRRIPEMIIVQAALLASIIALFSRFKASHRSFNLGRNVACLVGFFWAGIWTYFISTGAIIPTLIPFGYYLFEGIVLLTAFILHRPMMTFGEHLMLQLQFTSKATHIIFLHLLFLSFLSALSMYSTYSMTNVLVFAWLLILIDLYVRLNALEHPIPTWHEMFKDTKNSLLTLMDEVKSSKIPQKKKVVLKEKANKKRKKKK